MHYRCILADEKECKNVKEVMNLLSHMILVIQILMMIIGMNKENNK